MPESTGFAVDLAGVVNLGPDRLVLRGRAGIIGRGVLVRESYVAIRPEATFPLQAKLLADTIELGPWTVPIDSTIRRQLPKLSGAIISAHVVNHLPVAVTRELSLWRDWVPDTVRVGLGVPMPAVESGSGIVIQARIRQWASSLTRCGQRSLTPTSYGLRFGCFCPRRVLSA